MTIMRRTIVLAVALLLGLLVAAPALGQGRDPFEPQEGSGQEQPVESESSERDPFDPQEDDAQGTSDDPAVQEPDDPTDPVVEPTQDPAPVPDDEVESSTLANTGFDVSTWGAIAYLLIVLGIAAIVTSRTFAPVTFKRRK